MSRHVVRHIAVKAGEGFDLGPDEKVIAAEFDAPMFYLILLLEDDGMSDQYDGTPDA